MAQPPGPPPFFVTTRNPSPFGIFILFAALFILGPALFDMFQGGMPSGDELLVPGVIIAGLGLLVLAMTRSRRGIEVAADGTITLWRRGLFGTRQEDILPPGAAVAITARRIVIRRSSSKHGASSSQTYYRTYLAVPDNDTRLMLDQANSLKAQRATAEAWGRACNLPVDTMDESGAIVGRRAPEHLDLSFRDMVKAGATSLPPLAPKPENWRETRYSDRLVLTRATPEIPRNIAAGAFLIAGGILAFSLYKLIADLTDQGSPFWFFAAAVSGIAILFLAIVVFTRHALRPIGIMVTREGIVLGHAAPDGTVVPRRTLAWAEVEEVHGRNRHLLFLGDDLSVSVGLMLTEAELKFLQAAVTQAAADIG
ncbi:MAG: hypothetical protein PHS60_09975 [Zavarzinia sp.]|nr:hypothetical protein [Zavarzinia sp.]